MDNKQERERLKKLFSDLERLVVSPSGSVSAILPEIISLIADKEALLEESATSTAEIDVDSSVESQVKQQDSKGSNSYQGNQTDHFHINEQLKALPDSILTLPPSQNVISPPSQAGGQSPMEIQITPTTTQQSLGHELSLTNWQVAGIGTITGMIISGLVYGFTYQLDLFNTPELFAISGIEVLFGIMGALFGRASKKTVREVWIESAKWSLFPLAIALCLFLLLTLFMFTSFFGV